MGQSNYQIVGNIRLGRFALPQKTRIENAGYV